MTRRALTIIEVMAATVLLAALAVAVVPVLRDARAQVEARESRLEIFELGLIADRLVDEPEALGVPQDWPDQVTPRSVIINVAGTAISVRRVRACWIIFEHAGTSVARYVPPEEPS
jgi:hypothetical protein